MYTDVHRRTQMYTDVHRCTQMYTDVHGFTLNTVICVAKCSNAILVPLAFLNNFHKIDYKRQNYFNIFFILVTMII